MTTQTTEVFTPLLNKALSFAITVHEIDQKQKRKGKDVAYITHPIQVGLILAKAGASDEVVAAGLLHDTIEDSPIDHKVTKGKLTELFGLTVADLVYAVTEKNRGLTWRERKEAALKEILEFSPDALLLKSADVISNITELVNDYKQDGDITFTRFNGPKAVLITHALHVIEAILTSSDNNPIKGDLLICQADLERMK